jgi:hypothetical protein
MSLSVLVTRWGWGHSVVQHLLSVRKALGSIPSSERERERERRKQAGKMSALVGSQAAAVSLQGRVSNYCKNLKH